MLAFLCNLSIIIIIAKNRSLHKVQYYIVVNLAISDAILICIILIQHLGNMKNIYGVEVAYKMVALSSFSSVIALSVDRYIAVIYCLRYHALVTETRFQIFLAASWFGSILFGCIPIVFSNSREKRLLISYCIYTPTKFLGCMFLVFSSLWVKHQRDRHERKITRENIYFGIHGEKLTTLKDIKASVLSIIKLNVPTVVLVASSTAARLIHVYAFRREEESPFLYIKVITRIVYVLLNPFIYVISMAALKRKYISMVLYLVKKLRVGLGRLLYSIGNYQSNSSLVQDNLNQ